MRATLCALMVGASIIVPTGTGLTPCANEDTIPTSGDCVWFANDRGNGEGLSFIAHDNGTVTYLTD